MGKLGNDTLELKFAETRIAELEATVKRLQEAYLPGNWEKVQEIVKARDEAAKRVSQLEEAIEQIRRYADNEEVEMVCKDILSSRQSTQDTHQERYSTRMPLDIEARFAAEKALRRSAQACDHSEQQFGCYPCLMKARDTESTQACQKHAADNPQPGCDVCANDVFKRITRTQPTTPVNRFGEGYCAGCGRHPGDCKNSHGRDRLCPKCPDYVSSNEGDK